MYFRRYTRMHLYPAIKYFSKYGLLNRGYQKLMPLFNMQNPPRDHFAKKKMSKAELKQRDLDTKLIDNLFLKYPDLKYEPISSQKFPGRKFNTFSYAYSFIAEQKKLIKQGYTVDKAFEIVQKKYQQQMQRKLDQTLLSRGLAIGNRARSFLSIYQQQVQYESKLKVLRTSRQLQKYEQKLNKLRSRIESEEENQQDKQFNNYERMFQKIVKQDSTAEVQTKQKGKKPTQNRNQMISNIQKQFKNVFDQFYKRVTYKDRLEGLTDEQIIKNIHTSPNKIKRQNKQLIQHLKRKGSITIDHVGQIRVSQNQNPRLRQFLLTSPEIKIALLTQQLNYQKPQKPKKVNPQLMSRRSLLLKIRPDKLTPEEKQLLKYHKKLDLNMVSQSDIPNVKESYKIFESAEERLLRLQLKYLNMICEKEIQEAEKKRSQSDQAGAVKHQQRYEQAELTLSQTIQKFRRLKYRLQNRFRKSARDQFIFNEHEVLKEQIQGDDIQYEQLIVYLKKKSEQRRLTSISQANDNRIHAYLENRQLPQYPQIQGQVKKEIIQ